MVLVIVCAAQFVLILDVAVVNVALVPLAADLHAEPERLQLVASLYAAAFGGLLLVSGRIADSRGPRRTFLAGLTLFALASAVCAAAPSVPVLLAGRAVQGMGGALASPAALALLTALFPEGPARSRALGAWAAVAAGGGAAGLVLGGLLTTAAGWRWVFLVNLPVIAAIVLGARRVLPADPPARGRVPVGAAVTSTGAVVALVLGLGMVEARMPVGPAAAVLGGVCAARRRVRPPRPRAGSAGPRGTAAGAHRPGGRRHVGAAVGGGRGANFFLAVHLQQRLGLAPVLTGLAFLPLTVVSAATSVLAARVIATTGVRSPLLAGMFALAAGSALLAGLPVDGAYAGSVLAGMLLVAAGMGPGFTVGAAAATAGVAPEARGAAAALLPTATQVGGAVGLAAVGSAGGADPAAGARAAFAACAGAALLGAALTLALPGRAQPMSAPAPPAEAGPVPSMRATVPALPAPAACLAGCTDPHLEERP